MQKQVTETIVNLQLKNTEFQLNNWIIFGFHAPTD
jgi:hypothetical protein